MSAAMNELEEDPGLLPRSPLVLRREVMATRAQARDLIAQAEKQARRIDKQARKAAEQHMRDGHEEGVREGREEAARLLAEAAATVDAFYEARETELLDLAFAVAHRLIGELPERERLARIARAAVDEHRGSTKLMLRTDPGTVAALQEAMRDLDPEGRIEIGVDEAAPPGSCTLVHDRGRSAIGLLDQFRALMGGMGAS